MIFSMFFMIQTSVNLIWKIKFNFVFWNALLQLKRVTCNIGVTIEFCLQLR